MVTMAKIEIEYKYELENTDEVIKFLDKNAKLKYASHQIDTYYDSESVGYTEDLENGRRIDLWLRVREEGDRASINFKDWSISDNACYCEELESNVSDPKDVKGIFERMHFAPVIVVDKARRVYEFGDTEISIDQVKDLGDYIELEYYGKEKDVRRAQKSLKDRIGQIGAKVADQEDDKGYPYWLIERSRKGIS